MCQQERANDVMMSEVVECEVRKKGGDGRV